MKSSESRENHSENFFKPLNCDFSRRKSVLNARNTSLNETLMFVKLTFHDTWTDVKKQVN